MATPLKKQPLALINSENEVKALFNKAIEGEEDCLVPLEDEFIKDDNIVGYFDEDNGYSRIYHYDETAETLEKRILLDEQVSKFIDKGALASFMLEYIDPNALMCMEYIAFIYETEDIHSTVRDILEEEYGDEYAQYIAEDEGQIGCTWVERQIPVINVSNLIQSSTKIATHPDEYLSDSDIFKEGLLQTIFHECRHLFYECNEIVEIGEGTPYPQDGGLEDEVEDYGNMMAYKHIADFEARVLNNEVLEAEMPKIANEIDPEERKR